MKRLTATCLVVLSVSASKLHAAPDALEAKFNAQFARFDEARNQLIEQSGRHGATVTRDQWEQWIALPGDKALSDANRKDLRTRQALAIRKARDQALGESVIDLDQVRKDKRVEQFCRRIPKGGMLHIHPWGSLDEATARRILEKVDPKIPVAQWRQSLLKPDAPSLLYPHDLDFFASDDEGRAYSAYPEDTRHQIERLFFLPPGNHGFARFLGVFSVISSTVFTNKQVDPAPLMYEALFQRARDNGISYLEISEDARPYNAATAARLEKRNAQALKEYGLVVRTDIAFNRMLDADKNRQSAAQLLAMPASSAIVGINFVNDEGAHPALEKGQGVYAQVSAAVADGKSRLHRTMHAGELGDVRNVRDAMLMGAERVGHSVRLREDPVALEYARRRQLGVEANILSNERLLVVPAGTPHPFLDYLRLGLRVSLATDDEGIFETDLSQECVAAVTRTDLRYSELRRMLTNSINTSFVDEATKVSLAQKLDQDLARFENEWNSGNL